MAISVLSFSYNSCKEIHPPFPCCKSFPYHLLLRFPRFFSLKVHLLSGQLSVLTEVMLTGVNFHLQVAEGGEGWGGGGRQKHPSLPIQVLLSSAELSILPLQGEGIISVVIQRSSVNVLLLSCHIVTFIQRYFISCKACLWIDIQVTNNYALHMWD